MEPTPSRPAVVRRAHTVDMSLGQSENGALLVVVDSSSSARRLAGALVQIVGTNLGMAADDSGRALLSRVRERRLRLLVRRVGYQAVTVDVGVRKGFRDTLELGLAATRLCYEAIATSAHSAATGTLIVDVRTVDDIPITDSQVFLERAPLLFLAEQVDSSRYAFTNLPTGRYRLRVRRVGYLELADSVTVRPDAVDALRTQLRVDNRCDLNCGEVTFRKSRPWWLRWWPV